MPCKLCALFPTPNEGDELLRELNNSSRKFQNCTCLVNFDTGAQRALALFVKQIKSTRFECSSIPEILCVERFTAAVMARQGFLGCASCLKSCPTHHRINKRYEIFLLALSRVDIVNERLLSKKYFIQSKSVKLFQEFEESLKEGVLWNLLQTAEMKFNLHREAMRIAFNKKSRPKGFSNCLYHLVKSQFTQEPLVEFNEAFAWKQQVWKLDCVICKILRGLDSCSDCRPQHICSLNQLCTGFSTNECLTFLYKKLICKCCHWTKNRRQILNFFRISHKVINPKIAAMDAFSFYHHRVLLNEKLKDPMKEIDRACQKLDALSTKYHQLNGLIERESIQSLRVKCKDCPCDTAILTLQAFIRSREQRKQIRDVSTAEEAQCALRQFSAHVQTIQTSLLTHHERNQVIIHVHTKLYEKRRESALLCFEELRQYLRVIANAWISYRKRKEAARAREIRKSQPWRSLHALYMQQRCLVANISKTCVVCLDEDATHLLFPCGHRNYCHGCSRLIKACAICRAPKQGACKVYL